MVKADTMENPNQRPPAGEANRFIELSHAEMDALIHRVQEAIEAGLALSRDDLELVLHALSSLLQMQLQLGDNKVTLHKLRKLVGLVSASEKLDTLRGEKEEVGDADSGQGDQQKSTSLSDTTSDKKKPRQPPRQPKKPPPVVHHGFQGLKKGMTCPDCGQGALYKYEPATFIRITGQTPFRADRHVMEKLRCNACQGYQTASPGAEVLADGDANQRYGYSARSLMALNKFYMGAPYYRQDSLQAMLGEPIAASTIFDQCEQVANAVKPVFDALCYQAGNADLVELDDTTNRILDQGNGTEKPDRRTGVLKSRTGIYSSGVVATVNLPAPSPPVSEAAALTTVVQILLFQTNIGHAGEWLDSLLIHREPDQPPVKLMSDALACNRPGVVDDAIIGLCNAHARREFADLIINFRSEVLQRLDDYGAIWANEKKVQEQGLSDEARCIYHHTHSLPVMDALRAWGQQQLASGEVEENSGLGKAIAYFENQFSGLTRFCHVPGIPLDNNRMEGVLKLVIRNRKNAMFFKTLAGAAIGDVLTSLIATCHLNAINPFEYLIALQRYRKSVRLAPQQWLPWNYSRAAAEVVV